MRFYLYDVHHWDHDTYAATTRSARTRQIPAHYEHDYATLLVIHGIHDHSAAIGCTSRIMRYKSKALGNPGRSER